MATKEEFFVDIYEFAAVDYCEKNTSFSERRGISISTNKVGYTDGKLDNEPIHFELPEKVTVFVNFGILFCRAKELLIIHKIEWAENEIDLVLLSKSNKKIIIPKIREKLDMFHNFLVEKNSTGSTINLAKLLLLGPFETKIGPEKIMDNIKHLSCKTNESLIGDLLAVVEDDGSDEFLTKRLKSESLANTAAYNVSFIPYDGHMSYIEQTIILNTEYKPGVFVKSIDKIGKLYRYSGAILIGPVKPEGGPK